MQQSSRFRCRHLPHGRSESQPILNCAHAMQARIRRNSEEHFVGDGARLLSKSQNLNIRTVKITVNKVLTVAFYQRNFSVCPFVHIDRTDVNCRIEFWQPRITDRQLGDEKNVSMHCPRPNYFLLHIQWPIKIQ